MLHVTFGPSACGVLIGYLDELGRSKRTIFLPDDMAIGPLGLEATERVCALEDILYLDLPGLADALGEFWAEVTAAPTITVWMGRNCESEHAGWLEVANRYNGQLFLVDVVDFESEHGIDAPAFAVLPRREMLACRLADRALPVDDARRTELRNTWTRLRDERSSLRVVERGRLQSAPITHYDHVLLRFAAEVDSDDPLSLSRDGARCRTTRRFRSCGTTHSASRACSISWTQVS